MGTVNLNNIEIEGEFLCRGVDEKMQDALTDKERVKLKVFSKSPGNFLQMSVICGYNCGSRGERCSAKYIDGKMPDGTIVLCPHSRDLRVYDMTIESRIPDALDLSLEG